MRRMKQMAFATTLLAGLVWSGMAHAQMTFGSGTGGAVPVPVPAPARVPARAPVRMPEPTSMAILGVTLIGFGVARSLRSKWSQQDEG